MFSLRTWWRTCITTTDQIWHQHWPVVIALLILIALRLPNFTEPYWYGDEGIYLTIGQSLRTGERLYAEIIDHKTPLIYYLAMVSSQLNFRWLLLGWMSVTTIALYALTRQLWRSRWAQLSTGLVFVFYTTLPRLEGNIPNGELFVMGFILVGMWILSRTQWWRAALALPLGTKTNDLLFLLGGGIVLSLGILTKVPALFDVLAVGWLAWLTSWTTIFQPGPLSSKMRSFWRSIREPLWVGIGIVIPILVSIVYFVSRGSGSAYLDFGLLYNFRYAGSWVLPFTSPLLLKAFTLPGKLILMGSILLLCTLLQKWWSRKWSWLLGWVILALVGTTLSNRPYPHYFLQLIPAISLVIGGLVEMLTSKTSIFHSFSRKVSVFVAGGSVLLLCWAVIKLLGVWFYPTMSYYQNWFSLLRGQLSPEEYRQTFNTSMADNYRATTLITQDPQPYLFIWGTNPMLYAQTRKIPTGRFTVAFHIKDFHAWEETWRDFIRHQPTYVVVMNEDANSWPELNAYLEKHYIPDSTYSHFTLWRQITATKQL